MATDSLLSSSGCRKYDVAGAAAAAATAAGDGSSAAAEGFTTNG